MIVISIGVTVSEVILRFALLEKEKGKGRVVPSNTTSENFAIGSHGEVTWVQRDPRKIQQGLTGEEVEALCGMEIIGKTFAELGYC